MQWIDEHFALLFAFCVLWLLVCAAFFAWRRHKLGPMYPAFAPTDVRFSEKYVSGASHKNLFTITSGARNALTVTVLKDALIIEPMAFLKWGMPPGFGDLEHYVPRADILTVQPFRVRGRDAVRLKFRGRDDLVRMVDLMLRQHAAFLAALNA